MGIMIRFMIELLLMMNFKNDLKSNFLTVSIILGYIKILYKYQNALILYTKMPDSQNNTIDKEDESYDHFFKKKICYSEVIV